MTSSIDAKEQIWQAALALNNACAEGRGFDALRDGLHEKVIGLSAGFGARTVGIDLFISTIKDFCCTTTIHKLDALDPQIDLFGSTAIITHKYECIWEYLGKQLSDQGQVIMVYVHDDTGWKLAWRTMIPGSRKIETLSDTTEARTSNCISGDIRRACLDLMARAPVCTLTSIDSDGFPQTTAMLNLRNRKLYPSLISVFEGHDQDMVIYMTTGMQSNKIKRLEANPKVSVQFCDPDTFHNLMFLGHIEVVTEQKLKDSLWQPNWTMYYPNGKGGPEYGVLRLIPQIAKGWYEGKAIEFTPSIND
jgi:general stress protein 26